jgi:uncharacterized protein (TIGR00251 family)
MVAVESTADGVIIPVRVRAGARRTGIAGEHDGALRIDVSAAPEKGKANRAVAKVLAEVLHTPPSMLTLVSGAACNQKRFLAAGADIATVENRIEAALNSPT